MRSVKNIFLICFFLFINFFFVSGCLHPIEPLPENLFATISPFEKTAVPQNVSATASTETVPEYTATPEPTQTPTQTPVPTPTPSAVPSATPTITPEPLSSLSPEPDVTEPDPDTGDENNETEPDDVFDEPPGFYGSPYTDDGSLSDEPLSWYFMRSGEHQPPGAARNFNIRRFGGYYLGDTDSKTIYLTFDEGYENGYTGTILDILQEYGVHAAFFLTKPYIKTNPELIARMVSESHVAANHSVNHYSIPTLTDDEIEFEITGCADFFEEISGAPMPKFFRPPEGNYSARSLNAVHELGYKTIFWSFAYLDWDVNNQPGKDAAYSNVVNGLHNGAILLLHAVSSSNTEALPDIIVTARAMGYEFGSLYELK